MKIGVIGGSIAGLTSAVLLKQQGHDVTLLERSPKTLEERGAGIMLPEPLIQQCINLGLFDHDIPRIPTTSRSFNTQQDQKLWEQPVAIMNLNWADIYQNLHKRIPDVCYRQGEKVQTLSQDNQGYQVTTQTGSQYGFDFIIGADGIDSYVRKTLFPEISPQYSGYVAWRGTIPLSKIKDATSFKGHVPFFVYPNGHILLYLIPSTAGTNKPLLNWVMYDVCKGWSLSKLLTDQTGTEHLFSVPPGQLTTQHLAYLKTFAKQVLPQSIAEIVSETEKPFLQAIFDFQAPCVLKDKRCLIGDAAAVLRPHTASGVVKALTDSLSLAKAFRENDLGSWQEQQTTALAGQVALSKNMGEALVTRTPDWNSMTPATMSEWWAAIIAGKNWVYLTNITPAYDQLCQGDAINTLAIQSTQNSTVEKESQRVATKPH